MPRYCKVYMNEEFIENQKEPYTKQQVGLYAWGKVISEDDKGKVFLTPIKEEYEVSRYNVLIRERKDVTWANTPIIKKRIVNEIEEDENK